MGRLTRIFEKDNQKYVCIDVCGKKCVEGYSECHDCEPFVNVMKKLAEYENLEEQGRLIKLPCKVGDTAYHVYKEYLKDIDKWIKAIVEVEVDSFIININLLVNVSLRIGYDVFRKTLTPYKTLFFTKEEAEKALERMKGE